MTHILFYVKQSLILLDWPYYFIRLVADTGEAPHIMVYDKRSSRGRHTGVVVVVTLVALVGAAILGVFFCKRKKIIKQNAYITFSTPKYRREQLPNNDFNMESPLTLSSNGYTVLA